MRWSKLYSRFKKIARKIGIVALPIALFHAGTQIAYWTNSFVNQETNMRNEFNQEFGFPINGWQKDIEENGAAMSHLAAIINKEMIERKFSINALNMMSDSYAKKNLMQQVDFMLAGNLAYYFSLSNTIGLNDDFAIPTAIHEIKHAKTYDIIKEDSSFLEKWGRLSENYLGDSMYNNLLDEIRLSVRPFNKVNMSIDQLAGQQMLGFVNKYADRNVYEDIANLCELAEDKPETFISWIYGNNKNEKIINKVKLAEEYKLLPEEFSEYVLLLKRYNALGYEENTCLKADITNFIVRSRAFLEKHKDTVYESRIRNMNGKLFESKGILSEAIFEYRRSLTSSYKGIPEYKDALVGLNDVYLIYGQNKKAKIYREALREFERRVQWGDVLLSKRGLRDYLVR